MLQWEYPLLLLMLRQTPMSNCVSYRKTVRVLFSHEWISTLSDGCRWVGFFFDVAMYIKPITTWWNMTGFVVGTVMLRGRGGICMCPKIRLVIMDGNMTAQRYIDTFLQPVIVSFVRQHLIFLASNCPMPYGTTYNRLFSPKNVDTLPWSPYSPNNINRITNSMHCKWVDKRQR